MNINPKIVFEIGVGKANDSQCLSFFDSDVQCFLYEPCLENFKDLESKLSKVSNFHLNNCAVSDYTGEGTLLEGGVCSCLVESKWTMSYFDPPEKYGRPPPPKVKCKVVNFADIDPGNIDMLFIDTEGTVWPIIKNMKSRPKLLILELGDPLNKNIISPMNENLKEILEFLYKNNYRHVSQKDSDATFLLY